MVIDYYSVLGLDCTASQDEIKAAYRRLAMKWHPDHFERASEEERHHAEEMFKKINQAYHELLEGKTSGEWESTESSTKSGKSSKTGNTNKSSKTSESGNKDKSTTGTSNKNKGTSSKGASNKSKNEYTYTHSYSRTRSVNYSGWDFLYTLWSILGNILKLIGKALPYLAIVAIVFLAFKFVIWLVGVIISVFVALGWILLIGAGIFLVGYVASLIF